jgi:serine/threonine protein kinase
VLLATNKKYNNNKHLKVFPNKNKPGVTSRFLSRIASLASSATRDVKMAGEYEKVELLGAGSFGKAWLVNCSKKRRQAVLKEIRLEFLGDKEKGQTLMEVKILAKCRHVNIVSYYDAFIKNGCLHIVMEYADNGNDLYPSLCLLCPHHQLFPLTH